MIEKSFFFIKKCALIELEMLNQWKIYKKICNCSLCGVLPKLTENSIQYGTTKFIIVGESPAKDIWIESKRAFYNTSSKLQGSG